MDHDGQLIWEAYFNEMGRPFGVTELPDDKIQAVKQALVDGHTFTDVATANELTVHVVKQIAKNMDPPVVHPRGHVPGVPFNPERYWAIIARLKNGERPSDIARDKSLFPDDPVTGDPTTKSRQYIWAVQDTAKKRGIL